MERNHPRRLSALAGFVATVFLALSCAPAWAQPPVVQEVRDALRNADAETAVARAEHATGALPRNADAWYYAGHAYGWMAMEANLLRKPGWASKAHDAFRKAASLDPDHLGAREGLVQFYLLAPGFMGGGRDKAEAEITDFAGRNAAGGHYLRGLANKGAAAERELRTAVKLAPTEVRYRSALVGLLEREERMNEALSQIEAGLALAPGDARLLYRLGRHAAIEGQPAMVGEAALDRVIAGDATELQDVSLAGAHWRRGQLREKRGERAAAIADYRKAVALDGDLDDAREDLERLAE